MTAAPDPWTELAPGLLAHDDRRGLWSLRSHALRLTDGSWAVVSPTRGVPEAVHAALAARGPVSLLVAPNHFHHLGLRSWSERHPGARLVCADTAAPRLARQVPGVTFESPALLAASLPPELTVVEPPELRSGELWIRAELGARGVAWLVGDAFFNSPDVPRGAVGLFFRLTDTAPGLKLGRTFAWFAVQDAAVHRAWLEAALARDRPRVLIPAHGDVLEADDLPELLAGAARKRL